ncbi:MOSC domain-containing protein [Biformimicrobium ophioploci]|uniref:MOSC domain-containing protein n=1 Tax=Biformimicrobium ophioploci TaxID=3036711 RepID=A0ABQ6M128_9GAMM|nr:MOSC domain-containing protein [Microbulbifer sp. NKW57]GMG88028.1 MOSC domain-containing protein [Microbulbifer sp. NKW57]
MQVSALYQFPVKSLRGHAPVKLELDAYGAVGDRRWMLVDHSGKFVTQRRLRRMALLQASNTPLGLALADPDGNEISVPYPDDKAALIQIEIWGDHCTARDAGDSAAHWLEQRLQQQVRLVWMGPEHHRPVAPDYNPDNAEVSFADGMPLLLIGQASLDDLNSRLQTPVNMLRFRPNIVVQGAEPFAEDDWKKIRIGKLEMHVVKPCARCAIPGIDPLTAEASSEPLKTLADFRRWDDGQIYFGQNLVHRATGCISLGDKIEILK